MAIILFLRVRDIHIIPQWEHNNVRLGYVTYEKKDVFRSIAVGIAPVIVGVLFFWWLSALNPFQNTGIFFRLFMVYIIFVISSTMFSSKQDLIDIVYVIPLFIVVGILLYSFHINPFAYIQQQPAVLANIQKFLYASNWYLFYSICIHLTLIASYQLFNFFTKK